MMRKLNIVFFICIAVTLLLPGCADQTYYWEEEIHLGKVCPDSNRVQMLHAEKIQLTEEHIYARRFYVLGDSLLVIENKPSDKVPFIELCAFPSGETRSRFLRRGNGPGEMLMIDTFLDAGRILVHDFQRERYFSFAPDSCLRGFFPKDIIDLLHAPKCPYALEYEPGKLLLLNPSCFESEQLKIKNQSTRFYVYDYENQTMLYGKGKGKYDTYNVSQGWIMASKDKDRIVFASLMYPMVEIYDYGLNPIRRFIWEEEFIPKYKVDEYGVSFQKKKGCLAFGSIACHGGDLYLTFTGSYYRGENKMKSHIVKMNWEGEILNVYRTPVYISRLSFSQEGNVFYASGYDEEAVPQLYKLYE